jgi:hypothetical protein
MAQEQAKSPSGTAATGAKDKSLNPLEAMTRSREEKPGSASSGERNPDLPKRTSLAERLKAEQRKREGGSEAKREEPAKAPQEAAPKPPLEFTEPQAPSAASAAPPRQFVRTRRPAGPPPQRRLSAPANDDFPSIGGLIFALQQRPSRTPFLVALGASIAWFLIGGFFAFGLISNQVSAGGLSGLLGSTSALTASLALIVPIVIFWFLALLVWRAQELRLMASAMTEVAVRLAEPDRLAEQSVASVGQTIRRQVAAMNDAISRAIGRASELEAMVHSEVAALERSYGENEHRVRTLISELVTERQALANNSERVSEALKGVGAQIARDITAASASIDKKLAERGVQLTELLVARSSEAAEQVHKAQARVADAVPALIERLSKEQGRLSDVIEGASHNLVALEGAIAQRTTALDKTSEKLQASLAARIEGLENSVAQGALLLDKTLKDRTDAFTGLLSQGAVLFDNTLKQRTDALTVAIAEGAGSLDQSMKDRTEAFRMTIAEGAGTLDQSMKERTEAFRATIAEGAGTLDQSIKDRTDAFTNLVAQGAVLFDNTLKQRTEALTGAIGEGAGALDQSIKDRTDAFTNLVAQGAVLFDNTLKQRTEALTVAIGEGAGALDKALKDRTGYFNAMIDEKAALMDRQLHDRTAQFLTAINHGAVALDRTLAERAETFTNSLFQRVKSLENAIGQQTATLDRTMTERAQAVIVALAERLQAIDSTFNQRTAETDRMLGEHARATAETFGKQTAQLNQVLANNSAIIQQTANQVGAQSREAVSVLTSQTQTLREVSRGLLEQIHGLTQRFENQGQAILTAAKALDSSNTKIDSILEGRHQSIISLLHTVNTKAQDLDNMMRSYAGMVENAMSQAEARAKQVGTALARDTSGQAQAALAQIERLREEAQAHTARAVNDLKGSFETVITQIGRQLEQMRGQFDNTSRGMREAAQQTASDLESLRQEMQRRMEALPEHTAQATAAIRKALSEQLREIEAITPVLNRPAPSAPEPYRQAQAPAQPFPQFDARGRQMAQPEGGERVAGGLAQQLAGASYPPRPAAQPGATWSPSQGLAPSAAPPAQGGGQLRLDEIARAVDYRTATEIWQRFRSGERGVLGRHIYNPDGQATFDEIARRYGQENEFRVTVDRYIADFERLLGEAETRDPAGSMLQNYLTSESGRVYLLLAHASGRLR